MNKSIYKKEYIEEVCRSILLYPCTINGYSTCTIHDVTNKQFKMISSYACPLYSNTSYKERCKFSREEKVQYIKNYITNSNLDVLDLLL